MSKKKGIKINKDETLESIELELNNAIQFLDAVNQKVLETLKDNQKEDKEPEEINNDSSNPNTPNSEYHTTK